MNPISIIAIVFATLSFGLSAYAVGRVAMGIPDKEGTRPDKYCIL